MTKPHAVVIAERQTRVDRHLSVTKARVDSDVEVSRYVVKPPIGCTPGSADGDVEYLSYP